MLRRDILFIPENGISMLLRKAGKFLYPTVHGVTFQKATTFVKTCHQKITHTIFSSVNIPDIISVEITNFHSAIMNEVSLDFFSPLERLTVHSPRIILTHKKVKVKYPCNRPWKHIGLWDVEAPTFSLDNLLTDGGMVVSLTRRPPFTPQEDSWYSLLLEAESTSGP
jgi:hypothetical protein